MAEQEMRAAMAELGITVDAQFVPWSKSRNKAEKSPSLNWRVTLKRNGREILTTDYMAGSGHCPADKLKDKYEKRQAIVWECENGKPALVYASGHLKQASNKPIEPDPISVVHSLVLDGSAIDHGTFEDWASDYGYDVDSRKAESIYRACVEYGLKLRSALGDEGLRKLQEASQDY